MFKDLGIKGRVLLLTLLPTSLLALVLGGYFTWVQLSDMRAQLIERGQLIAEQLAPLSAPALAQNNTELLSRIATEALDQPDVRAVTFLNPERERLVHAGPSILTPIPSGDGSHLSMTSNLDTTHFLLPVLGRHRSLSGELYGDSDKLLGWVELELSHHGTLLRGYRSLFTSLLLIITGLVVTALLALRMSRAINAPLGQIAQGVAQLKEGRLETRLPALGSHELDELAGGINRMAEALQSAQEEMQHNIDQATEDVRQNLETIEIQNIELDLARKEALEASRIKSEFLANMSHEIRTPLNGILGFTNLLQKSELTSRQQDYLGTIHKSAESLLGIINEILDFSKIEAGKLVLENIPFNLRELIQDTLTILAPAAHEKQLELVSLIYRDTPLQLVGDPQRLKQVLTNLVSNAIKFTHEGSIAVRAMLEDESDDRAQLRISVQDTGVGLTDADLRALFQAFSQADNSLSRQAGGTGLGLVISKRLIEQMGGEIGVDSSSGEGSEFWISLNLPKARDDGDDLLPALAGGQRVALYEPHELTRTALHHQLEDCGLEVSEFPDLAALERALAADPQGKPAIGLALLGVTSATHPPELLRQSIRELEQHGCKSLVLCPTIEQAHYNAVLPESQVQSKPACTRKLQQALNELLHLRPTRKEKIANGVLERAPHLLCVDDNPANLLLVKTLLSDMGAQVVAVDSGLAAVEAVQRERFDLVFMDVQMPGMDGRQATDAIRQWEADREVSPVPIIALTAHALANEKRALLQGGMDDYLTKPIDERQLAQVLLKWTGLHLGASRTEPHSAEPGLNALSVLDPAEGLRLAAGKAELAADMLGMLLASLSADRQVIRQARERNDRNTLLERIHRLHGATRYCGVPMLRAACQRAETLLKQNDPDAPAALNELDKAMTELARATENREAEADSTALPQDTH
ncbi:response regulator [Pseudomonas sp.]|uniref:response regulator n=1 Tax=Pseudomonas sp. TaxID=306 RepID=UPI0031DC21CB